MMADRYRGTTAYVRVLAELVRAAEYRGLTTYRISLSSWGFRHGVRTWAQRPAESSVRFLRTRSGLGAQCSVRSPLTSRGMWVRASLHLPGKWAVSAIVRTSCGSGSVSATLRTRRGVVRF
jgi:hypothetical protein